MEMSVFIYRRRKTTLQLMFRGLRRSGIEAYMYLLEKSASEAGKEVGVATWTCLQKQAPDVPAVAQAWLRSIHHYIFLADPRTEHAIGEPKADNKSIVQLSLDATMHIETVRDIDTAAGMMRGLSLLQLFDFPYKRSVLTFLPRERFFKMDVL